MDYAEIKMHVSMQSLLSTYGITVRGNNRCACPLHGGDNKDAFSVASDGQSWKCFTGDCGGGDIFSFVEKFEGIDNSAARLRIMDMFNLSSDKQKTEKKVKKKPSKLTQKAAIVKKTEYEYKNAEGKTIYKSIRVDYADGKKDCFQECNGKHTLPENVRTLYNLPNIVGNVNEPVFLCEGEKTAEAVIHCGYIGTTNPLGSKNWNKRYAEHLKGLHVVIMPDSDEHGEKWRDEILSDLAGVASAVQVANIPSEFVKAHPEFTGHDFADLVQVEGRMGGAEFIEDVLAIGEVLPNGVDPELLGRPCDTWKSIVKRAKAGISTNVFNFNEWLPSMNINVKQGDLVVLMANTSTGKTRILHNIPFHIRRLNYAIFDLELSKDVLAMRYAAMTNKCSIDWMEHRLENGHPMEHVDVDNVFVQKIEGLTITKIKERVELIERVTGKVIHVVSVDYIGLMANNGSSYESTSNNVEEFKSYISSSGKIGILTTQVARPADKEDGMFQCPSPFAAKNSGSIENSAQELIGIWKDKNIQKKLHARVMKYTHGSYPEFDIPLFADDLLITEMKEDNK